MKFGFRVPSIKKRIAARTSPKRYIRHNLGLKAPRGMGWFTNPKKAVYNRVYNRTSVGCTSILIILLLLTFLTVAAAAAFGQSATVIAEQANLRGRPSNSGKIVDKVSQNETVEVMRQKGAWFLVQAKDFAGWLHGDTIRLDGSLTLETVDPSSLTVAPVPLYTAPRTPPRSEQRSQPAASGGYIRGPRGGCYYLSRTGRKVYVDRSLCK